MLRALVRTLVIVATLYTCGELRAQSHIHISSIHRNRIGGAQVFVVKDGMPQSPPLDQEADGSFDLPAQPGNEIRLQVRASGYVTRQARLRWNNPAEFSAGFAVPVWREADLNALSNLVVRDPGGGISSRRSSTSSQPMTANSGRPTFKLAHYGNPDEIAVVLAYDRSIGMPSPMVMAKGTGADAVRLRQSARCARSVIDPPLARALYAQAEVGLDVPDDLMARVIESFRRTPIASITTPDPPSQIEPPPPYQPPPYGPPPYGPVFPDDERWFPRHPIRIGSPLKRHVYSIFSHFNPTRICD